MDYDKGISKASKSKLNPLLLLTDERNGAHPKHFRFH